MLEARAVASLLTAHHTLTPKSDAQWPNFTNKEVGGTEGCGIQEGITWLFLVTL